MFDYDGDGRQDLFFVNGTTLEGFPKGQEPRPHLYRNRDGTALRGRDGGRGPQRTVGLGTGGVRRRLRQRRPRGSARHLLRPEPVVPQHRPRTVRRCHRRRGSHAGSTSALEYRLRLHRLRPRRSAGSVRRQLHRSRSRHRADAGFRLCADSRACRSRAVHRASREASTCCTTTSATAGSRTYPSDPASLHANGSYGLGVSTLDFDNDGWTDLYVANDSNPSALYRNRHDGTFEDVGVEGRLRVQPGRQAAGRHGRGRLATSTATGRWTS